MGAAGDMLTAALLELHDAPEAALTALNRAFTGMAVLSVQQTIVLLSSAIMAMTLLVVPRSIPTHLLICIDIPPLRNGQLHDFFICCLILLCKNPLNR